jgi:putative transposase
MLITEEGKKRMVFVKDNFSKALLHKAIVPNGKSSFIKDVLQATFYKYNLLANGNIVNIISDGGSENLGVVTQWVQGLEDKTVCKVVARSIEFEHSNSMIESLFNIFKNEFVRARKINIVNENALWNIMNLFEEYYNHNRFPGALHGFSPFEVLNGAVPDKKRYQQKLIHAKEQRLIENGTLSRCGFCK